MKFWYYTFFICTSFYSQAQTILQGFIKDLKTKEPIPYCAIALKSKPVGCLSNTEGLFQISARIDTDTLIVSYIGYKRKQIAISDFVKSNLILLEATENILNEVVVYSNDDYLYQLIESCRKKILSSKQSESKVYFVLESSIREQPVELLECYYNGTFTSSSLKSLDFKNGRVGVAPYNERFFINSNISKAFTFLSLLESADLMPANPLQFNARQLRKKYSLRLRSLSDAENPLYHIEFNPLDSNGRYFSGELWIEKNSGNIKKVRLTAYTTKYHPFLPLFKQSGSVENASMQISKTYVTTSGESLLDHIDFNYQLNYRHLHQRSFVNANSDTTFSVESKGIMHFYDYGNAFTLPYFNYDEDLSDYRKITSLTFNEAFWNNNNSLVYSNKMKKGISYFKSNGILINYKNTNQSVTEFFKNGSFFENNYIMWSDRSRLSLKKNGIKNDTIEKNSSGSQGFLANRYRLKAQIFLDLNPMQDSVQHYSVTIFDVYQTYYNIAEEPFTNCFMNIYFDLVEIERRNMEKAISKANFTIAQFDSLYKVTQLKLEEKSQEYFSKVDRGKNVKVLETWNNYVKLHLGIDNFGIFQMNSNGK